MTPAELDADLALLEGDMQKLAGSLEGSVRIAHFGTEFQRVATAYANPATRAEAESLLKVWAEGEGGLRKRIATHWLDRARATLGAGGATPAAAAGAGATAKPVHPLIARLRARRKVAA